MKKEYHHPSINQVEDLSARLIQVNRELEEKNRQLEESEIARKNIFSNVTHDLRAPVAAMRGAAERLSSEGLSGEELNKMIRIIMSRTENLDRLINDLYFSMLVEQPGFSPELSYMEISPVLEEFFISMEGAGRFNGRKACLDVPEEFSAFVMLDPHHFIRVLDNLLMNALRHTEQDDLIILGCREYDDRVEVYVQDTGSGIPESDLPHIFDSTFAGEGARTPGKSGSGLGLSIARTIVEKHGGKISCKSVFGGGTTFVISLPLA